MPAPRLVLDTNVALDLFVFDDPRCRRLRHALSANEFEAVTNAACRAEWLRVLRYPKLALDPARRDAAECGFDALIAPIAVDRIDAATYPALPRCADPDDQKFLELARDAGAVALLSRDILVLKLARRCERTGAFRIVEPENFDFDTARAAPGPPR